VSELEIQRRSQIESLAYCGLAIALMVVFMQTIGVWRWLTDALGKTGAILVPFVLAVVVFGTVLSIRLYAGHSLRLRWSYLIVAALVSAIALYIPDPQFPAKRIHVAEFMLLAFLIRRGFCRWTGGIPLITLTAICGIVLGAHDELLQGLHPDRRFGHTDIVVDGLASIAGALAGHGLKLYDNIPKRDVDWIFPPLWALVLVAAGFIAFLFPLPAFQELPLPLWTLVPLSLSALMWYTLDQTPRPLGDPASVIVWLVFLMIFYPVLTHMTSVVFQ